jgi:hypothetical protein
MSGSSSIGRGGGHIGLGGPSRGCGDDDDEEEEAKKRRFDAARLRKSRRFTKYGIRLLLGFNKWEARTNQVRPLPGSPASAPAASRRSCYDAVASSSSSAPGASSSRVSRAAMEVDAPPPPLRSTGTRIGPEDFVAEDVFPRILEMIEESSRREVELAARWKREAELQELVDAVSSSDDLQAVVDATATNG